MRLQVIFTECVGISKRLQTFNIRKLQSSRVISFEYSANEITVSCLGTNRTLYGIGDLPLRPSYSSRQIGSPGSSCIVKLHKRREMAKKSSRSATWRPGQILRLQKTCVSQCQAGRMQGEHIYPAPNVQWSRSITLASFADSAHESLSSRYRSGLKVKL